jgi:hypothetical protein
MNTDRKDTGKHTTIRLDPWIRAEIENLAKDREMTFTDVVNHLLEYQLNQMGLSKAKYEAKIFGLERVELSRDTKKTGDIAIKGVKGNGNQVMAGIFEGSTTENAVFNPADGIGKLGDAYHELERVPEDKRAEVLKKVIAILSKKGEGEK